LPKSSGVVNETPLLEGPTWSALGQEVIYAVDMIRRWHQHLYNIGYHTDVF